MTTFASLFPWAAPFDAARDSPVARTAAPVIVAIPAVLAYNFFVRANRVTNAQFDEFAHDLHDFFATGARVETGGAAVPARPATPAIPPKK